nr:aluminum-activated malate transporter 10 [Tanacetum cinerariifolium]
MRSCAYCIETLNGFISSEVQAPELLKKHLKEVCMTLTSMVELEASFSRNASCRPSIQPRLIDKSSAATLTTSVLTPISVAYLLIQYMPAVTVATPTGLGIKNLKGDERRAANGAPMREEA